MARDLGPASGAPGRSYQRRIIDDELDELLAGLPAVTIEGPRGAGKTATALQRAGTAFQFDDEAQLAVARADPSRLTEGGRPVVIDEWQRFPLSFDLVRRAVDDGALPGSFLLTASAFPSPKGRPVHSGAGRIVPVRLRPMALSERGLDEPTVSLSELLTGSQAPVTGRTQVRLAQYAEEILRSGFPGISPLRGAPLTAQLDAYLTGIIDRDCSEAGQSIRRPQVLRQWMAAYAAATSTTASYEAIRTAATGGRTGTPARTTAIAYRDVLERLFILDPVPAWLPVTHRFAELSSMPRHQLADPALAARLLRADAATLLAGRSAGPEMARQGTLLGALFESLVTQSVRVYAQAAEACVSHLRTRRGDHEIDLIVEQDGGVLALDVRLAQVPADHDLRHLRWLQVLLGSRLLDAVVITTGSDAYRRGDGIAVVPAALLGP